ncbi:unnamed protein product [Paramecium sonneborni]|uniref:Uncharacterized protein n=1 Tax=Paramecium sonneborni TaxID=65129 RepID=A0A8S1NHC8_9CILI|nr:unnamed protein product [Paramecium sonneborni]
MELKNDEMNDIIRQTEFKDIDVTNWYEFSACLILSIMGNALLIMIFQKIQNLFLWKKEDSKNNPSKMLSVNCLLLITILFKIFACYYSITGFLFSQFWNWKCNSEENYLTISSSFYLTVQICQAQTLNLTFCFCSNLWLKLWRMKLKIDQNKSLLSLTNILQLFLSILIVAIPIVTIISLILEKYVSTSIGRDCLGALTILSTISFAIIILILHSKLKDQYSVGNHFRSKLKYLSIGIIICALLRPSFNFLFSYEFFWKLKPGQECDDNGVIKINLPDQGSTWAIFQFSYSLITDLIPIYILSLLFSPNFTKRKQLVNVGDGWDSGLE